MAFADIGRRGYVAIDPDYITCLEANLSPDLALIDEPPVYEIEDPSVVDDFGWEAIAIPPLYGEAYNPDQVSQYTVISFLILIFLLLVDSKQV